jgi:hypothetical protein
VFVRVEDLRFIGDAYKVPWPDDPARDGIEASRTPVVTGTPGLTILTATVILMNSGAMPTEVGSVLNTAIIIVIVFASLITLLLVIAVIALFLRRNGSTLPVAPQNSTQKSPNNNVTVF